MPGIRPWPQYLTDGRIKTDPQMVAVQASVTEMAVRGGGRQTDTAQNK